MFFSNFSKWRHALKKLLKVIVLNFYRKSLYLKWAKWFFLKFSLENCTKIVPDKTHCGCLRKICILLKMGCFVFPDIFYLLFLVIIFIVLNTFCWIIKK